MHKLLANQHHRIGLLVLAVVLICLIVFFALQVTQPTRSVAAYCSVYKQEKSRLSRMSNSQNAYPSGVFNVTVADAGQVAQSLGKLGRVAPAEIEPDVTTLQKLYQEIHDDPSRAIAASLSGGSLDDAVKQWTQEKCRS